MASPPFQVEDQTDEDFFDKLVDDEFGVEQQSDPRFTTIATDEDVVVDDGGVVDSSDVAKAFSNLSVNEAVVGTASEDSTGEDSEKRVADASAPALSDDAPEKDILVSEESVSFVSSNPVNTDTGAAVDAVSESTIGSKNSGSKSTTCIKEVQWSSFHADSNQQYGSGFGSYSDLFVGAGDDSGADPFATVGDGDSRVDPFATVGDSGVESNHMYGMSEKGVANAELSSSISYGQTQNESTVAALTAQEAGGQEVYDSQYWENMYPGWRYDANTGEWVQVEGYNAAGTVQGSVDNNAHTTGNEFVSGQKSEISYLQQGTQSVSGTVDEGCITGSVSTWNQGQQETTATEYPAHMIFDPQYPGWYYDSIAQEWRTLESYTSAIQSTNTTQSQGLQSGNNSSSVFSSGNEHSFYGDGQVSSYASQNVGVQDQGGNWAGISGNYAQQNVNMWQPETVAKQNVNMWQPETVAKQNVNMWQPEIVAKNDTGIAYTNSQQMGKLNSSRDSANNLQDRQVNFAPKESASFYNEANRSNGGNSAGFQSFVPSNFALEPNQSRFEHNQQHSFSSNNFYGNPKPGDHLYQNTAQLPYIQQEDRSPDGRPPHALVTFGFGGKLIVMKNSSSFVSNSTYGSKDSVGGSITVLDVMDVVADKSDTPLLGIDYFRALCQQSFPGPLVGGNVGSKELIKWIDDRIANCESQNMEYRKRELLRLLLSLLKIASQHYGKLRSPFGTDSMPKENGPETAIAKLFASAKRNGGYVAVPHCLQDVPSDVQIRATAAEVQNLLVSGRTKEALQYAQEGQLWGPALILAAQLGDQFYVDTVKQMAQRQLVAGSPLRTLCLLIAGQPADVFSTNGNNNSSLPGAVNLSQHHAQVGSNRMLDDWEENLAIIAANRTKGDELVVLHLGDCLWKERGEITAAHICYLVAEANFESFSDTARLCLLGADHWKYPRTYTSPEAIQRTEFYEYSMVLGNSQSILLPFQPYKLIYAYMLAEVGKLSDALKYCQALMKSLKTGRAPEVDVWKQLVSTLEERIKTHQQGGFSTNLAAGKLVGKLLPFIDRSIHRMIGPPPPVPSANGHEHDNHPVGPRVANSQSTMAMSSLMPSPSMETVSAWGGGGNRSMHNRSVSEPDFGRTPRQVDPSKETTSPDGQGKTSDSGGPSRFGRIGSTLIQKTMGWVSRSRSDRQAKLGEKNKFYYDEKLKRWVEEGAEPPAEETAAAPPPTTTAFQNGMSDYNIKHAFKGESSPANGMAEVKSPTHSDRSGMPPIPPSSNQFSARGRMGVRSRYVDTFNKDKGAQANFFQSPSISAAKPSAGANAKFFVPTPNSSGEQTADVTAESRQEAVANNEDPPTFISNNSFSSPPNLFSSPPNSFSSPPNSFSSQPVSFSSPPNSFSSLPQVSSSSMQRFPSMNNITPRGSQRMEALDNGNGPASRSRRTSSWSGAFNAEVLNPSKVNEIKPLGEQLGIPASSYLPSDQSSMHLPMNGGSFGEDLQEVEL